MSVADDLARIALQERELQFSTFKEETAWQLGNRLRGLASARNLSVVIDVRRYDQQLFYTALAGTTPDNQNWVRRKSNLTLRFHKSSYAIGLALQEKNTNLLDHYAISETDYACHGGCFPIRVAHAGMIGCLTVSGLPQRADHELAVEALCAELGRDYAQLRLP